jgi:hypothetical protein
MSWRRTRQKRKKKIKKGPVKIREGDRSTWSMSRGNTVKTTMGAKKRIKGVRSKNGKGRNKEKMELGC